jgi:proteasome assembly chaperone (PAC2) family protein
MAESLEIWEKPEADEIYMIVGWRQWADAGSVSSGLPDYLIQQTDARQIGAIRPDGFYLFQFPGTHDLVRPVVKFDQGYPEWLQTQHNELFYTGDQKRGLVFFLGDEPHLDVERYIAALLEAAKRLNVKRIIGLGGVYGEIPYDKERPVSCNYSLHNLKAELDSLAVSLSDYQGGASIGSILCKRAGEQGMEYIGFYAFVPTYDFSNISQVGSAIRIETDYMAWLGVMRRVDYLLKLNIDWSDLEKRSEKLIEVINQKVEEIDKSAPQLDVRDYMNRLGEEFTETTFDPLDDVWEEELRRLLDKFDDKET